jgi:uncharacterized protein
MSSSEFKVPARDLDAAGRSFQLPVRAAWLRGAVEGTDVSATDRDGVLDVRVSKSGNDVVVRGTLRAELVVPCARCLEPARVAIHEPVSALFVPASRLRAESAAGERGKARDRGDDDDAAGTADSPDVVAYDGETVVMDGLVRDEMLLALPIVPLCSEACAGIRLEPSAPAAVPAPSDDVEVDPRLRPLLSLKHKT